MSHISDVFKSASKFAAAIVFMIGCLVLLGWGLDIPLFKGLLQGESTMKANTAVCLILAAISLWVTTAAKVNDYAATIAKLCAFLMCLICLVTIAEYVFHWNAHIDQLLFRDSGQGSSSTMAGRMAPATALCLLLDGIGLMAIGAKSKRAIIISQMLFLAAFLIALMAIVGYVYDAASLYKVEPYASMALHSAIAIIVISLGSLFADTETGVMSVIASDGIGGRVARRVLPVSIIFPVIVGWLRLKGQHAGLYDAEFGLGLGVLTFVSTFSTLIWWNALSANRAEAQLVASRERLRSLSVKLQQVREQERTSIAREIHDELGQQLTALQMDLFWLDTKLSNLNGAAMSFSVRERTHEMMALVDTAIQSVQRIATELRPGVLDDLGLKAAMEWQAKDFQKRSGIKCALTLNVDDSNLEPQVATAMFRIMQESLTNVSRHAGASQVQISLGEEADKFTLAVSDNGKGIEKERTADPKSLGLLGMHERVFLLKGTLEINGKPGEGTTVTARVPRPSMS